MFEQATHEHRDREMRRLHDAAGAWHATWLGRGELKCSGGVGGDAPEAADRLPAFAECRRVSTLGVGLPNLDQRVVNRFAVAVQHATAYPESRARARDILNIKVSQADLKIRSDRLIRCNRSWHATSPAAGRRDRARRYRNESQARIPDGSFPSRTTTPVTGAPFRPAPN